MGAPYGQPGRSLALRDRSNERGVLDRLLVAVRTGDSRVLVMRGDPGVGKTALLNYLVLNASDCKVVRVAGVQSEMELAFAGLHLLCAPMLDRLDQLAVPQRDALPPVPALQWRLPLRGRHRERRAEAPELRPWP